MTTPTAADIAAELDGLPAAMAAARAAADPAEVMRLENRDSQLRQQLHRSQGRDLADQVEALWAHAQRLMSDARDLERQHRAAEDDAEQARRTVLLSPGTTNDERTATFRSYNDASTRAETLNQRLRTVREAATAALMAVDEAMDNLVFHVGPVWESPLVPLHDRRLLAHTIVGEDTVGVALTAHAGDDMRPVSLVKGQLLPRATAYRLGAHLLGTSDPEPRR